MSRDAEQVLLRVYLQSADRPPHTPTYQRIVQGARSQGLAGAAGFKGVLGVGYHGEIRQRSDWSLVEHVPVIVEIVDAGERIREFVGDVLDKLMIGGMATLEHATVILRRPAGGSATQVESSSALAAVQSSANM